VARTLPDPQAIRIAQTSRRGQLNGYVWECQIRDKDKLLKELRQFLTSA
jgi:hypothetical protein